MSPPSGESTPPSCLAFFLPQYHPIAENDEWWGTGFTEWTNVTKARPRFPGHYQPHLPADLGFYDLRLEETREAQAALAAAYGIDGFVYYHYWFSGKRVLERPVDAMIASGRPDFPFCLAWVNENWTRAWDGGSNHVLLQQDYSAEDDLAHIRALRPALTDPRYITVDGKPVLLVYRATRLPEPRATTDRWREEVIRWGLPGMYLLKVESTWEELSPPEDSGFDASVEFQPRWWDLPSASRLLDRGERALERRGTHLTKVRSYRKIAARMSAEDLPPYPRWPGLTPMWDNSPRRKPALILVGSTPRAYERWLDAALVKADRVARDHPTHRPFVFINAWNEWGESNHLEPDQRHGRAYLEANQRAVERHRRTVGGPPATTSTP